MTTVTFHTDAGNSLVYALNDSEVTSSWLAKLRAISPKSLMRQQENHRHGFASAEAYESMCKQLREVAASLNIELPYVLDQQALNTLHLNFPNCTHGLTNANGPYVRKQLMSLNLLIHWIEYERGSRQQYVFNLDFNHDASHYSKPGFIPESQLNHFSSDMAFGSLHLHYTYTGRHFLEMFDAEDITAPSSHFRPQRNFNATCGLVFSEPQDNAARQEQMLAYYVARGGRRFWPHDFDDPRMCKGFFQLGQLQNVDLGDIAARTALRNSLATDHIVNWTTNDS